MAVPTHTKYTKIAELKTELSSLYTKLTSINDDKFKNIVREFMYDPNSKPQHVPNVAATELTIAPVAFDINTNKASVSHFQNLLKDAVDCHIEPNTINPVGNKDNNINMIGLLKFVKGQTTAMTASTVIVLGEDRVANNIISSVNLINTFLSILDSYMEYIKSDADNALYDINNIFIVRYQPVTGKKFKYLEDSTGVDTKKPMFRALYLQLNEKNYTSLVAGSSIEVDTGYDGVSDIKSTALRPTTIASIFTTDTLNLVDSTGSKGYVRGIRIRKQSDSSIIDEMNVDGGTSMLPATSLSFQKNTIFNDSIASAPFYGPNLKKRDKYLLKHFLNLIFNIRKESRYSTIKILQTYYTVMKILLLTAVNTGNHLYNSKYTSGTTLHTSATLFGLKGIEGDNFDVSTLYSSDTTATAFKTVSSYVDISTTANTNSDVLIHAKINTLIEKITIESANTISVGTTLPVLSNGFYAKKIDDKHIEISKTQTVNAPSGIVTTADWQDAGSFLKTGISSNSALDDSIKNDFSNVRINNIKNKYKLRINGGRYNIVEIYKDGETMYKYKINASLADPNLYPKSSGVSGLDNAKYKILDYIDNTFALNDNQSYINDAQHVIFKTNTTSGSEENKVTLVETTPQDNTEEYNDLKTEIMGYSENIKMNKSKINNYVTLYELHKSKHSILNNQLIAYYVIIAVLIGIIVTINLANIEKPFIKTIATGCFSTVVLLFISYYVMNVVYINEEFTVEHFASAFAPMEPTSITMEYQDPYKNAKKAFVEGRMNNYCEAIILALKILKPSLENSSLINSTDELLRIGKNESDQRLYINNILINKRDKSEINIDVLKYENMNLSVHIKALLVTSLIVIGVYTLHLYIEPKYLDLLLFVSAILLISVFTYFIVYSNKIVRTTSSNNYWGKEYETQYGII